MPAFLLYGCLHTLLSFGPFTNSELAVAYDQRQGQWLLDPAGIVSRNDVLYETPSAEPWEAMPVGGGDFSAMVWCDGSGLDLHLTKSDAWGFQEPPDAPLGRRFFNNVSPGHVRIEFSAAGRDLATRRFRQRLDLYHGRIVLDLGPEDQGVRLEIWGHPERRLLVIEVWDSQHALAPQFVELSQWRPTMQVTADDTTIGSWEVHTRPARPHLANTGMENHFGEERDPLLGRGTAVCVGTSPPVAQQATALPDQQKSRLGIQQTPPAHYSIFLTAAVTADGKPLKRARQELDDAMRVPLATLRAEQEQWWRDWWSRTMLRIHSSDQLADWLCAAYHVHLYTLGCVNRGPVPCKWDGGPGLMRGDERTWGISEWVQEIRFTYLPLYAANQLEMARGLTRFYTHMVPYLEEQTVRVWSRDGLWIPETVTPWGHAEDLVMEDIAATDFFLPWDPASEGYGNFRRFNGYVTFLFTSGLEICQHYLLYYRYSGDEDFLRGDAYPVIRGVCRFLTELLQRDADGCYHLDPANALETWWLVRDPADTRAGMEAIFPEFIRLSEQYGDDQELRAKCREILEHLPPLPMGHWDREGKIDSDAPTYAPAAAPGRLAGSRNFEIPALYRVFPFELSGIDAPDLECARATFTRRIFGITNSWSLDAVWASRLGLNQEAGELLKEHAVRYNRFRYGGWDSSNSTIFPDGLSVVPYVDGAGLSAFATQDVLLQSHGGVIRLLPAAPKNWSGIFRLRAEGGFLVAVDFAQGQPRLIEIHSERGRPCRIRNPWDATCVVRRGDDVVLRTNKPLVEFATQPGARYLLESADRPIRTYDVRTLTDTPRQEPGLLGRGY